MGLDLGRRSRSRGSRQYRTRRLHPDDTRVSRYPLLRDSLSRPCATALPALLCLCLIFSVSVSVSVCLSLPPRLTFPPIPPSSFCISTSSLSHPRARFLRCHMCLRSPTSLFASPSVSPRLFCCPLSPSRKGERRRVGGGQAGWGGVALLLRLGSAWEEERRKWANID